MEEPEARARRRKVVRRAASRFGWDVELGREHLAECQDCETDEISAAWVHHAARMQMTLARKTFGHSYGVGPAD
jgi:hypothetical protein